MRKHRSTKQGFLILGWTVFGLCSSLPFVGLTMVLGIFLFVILFFLMSGRSPQNLGSKREGFGFKKPKPRTCAIHAGFTRIPHGLVGCIVRVFWLMDLHVLGLVFVTKREVSLCCKVTKRITCKYARDKDKIFQYGNKVISNILFWQRILFSS